MEVIKILRTLVSQPFVFSYHTECLLNWNNSLILISIHLRDGHADYHSHEQCQFRPQYLNSNNNRLPTINGWTRGSYQCLCSRGYYSKRHPDGFNGTIMEVAYEEYLTNASTFYVDSFICLPCMEGCESCSGPTPCLATYNWPFR